MTKANLAEVYGEIDEQDVAEDDGDRVAMAGSTVYLAHQYRVVNNSNQDRVHVHIQLQSTRAPTAAAFVLQVWNETDQVWENLTTTITGAANTDIDVDGRLESNLSEYYDSSYELAFRIYQETGGVAQTLSVDLVEFCFSIVYDDIYTDPGTTYDDVYTDKNC